MYGDISFHRGTSSEVDRGLVFNLGGNEKMRLLHNGGLTFNGDTAAANALDDYEEGAWTPAGTSSGGSWGSGSGRYVKIGSTVYCKGTITCTASGSNNALTGFPFANSSDYDVGSGFETQNTGHQILVRITGGGTGGAMRQHNNGNSFGTNDLIKFSITYTIV